MNTDIRSIYYHGEIRIYSNRWILQVDKIFTLIRNPESITQLETDLHISAHRFLERLVQDTTSRSGFGHFLLRLSEMR